MPAVKLAVGTRTDPVVFFKGASEVLAAVIAGLECNIRDREGAVDEEKDGMLQPFLINIVCNRTVHVSGEQRLQIGFIDTGMPGQSRDAYLIRKVGGDIVTGPFQVEHSGIFVAG